MQKKTSSALKIQIKEDKILPLGKREKRKSENNTNSRNERYYLNLEKEEWN